jgi:hypothetical protein
VLARAVEDDGARGHVDAHREGLGGEEDLDEPAGEEDLHDWGGVVVVVVVV